MNDINRCALGTITILKTIHAHHTIPSTPSQPMTYTPKDDPMQIKYKTWFKPFIKQEKQQHANKLCLSYGELDHIANSCPKKQMQHIASTTFIITPHFEDLGNEDV